MKQKIWLIIVLCAVTLFMTAAAETGATAQWDSGSNRVTLEATMEKSGTLYTIRILPESVSPDSLSLQELSEKRYVLRTVRTDKNAVLRDEFTMPDWLGSGIYVAYISSGDELCSAAFSYVSQQEAQEVLSQLNQAGEDAFKEILSQRYNSFGMVQEQYMAYQDTVNDSLFLHRPSGGYQLQEFLNEAQRTIALCMIADGQSRQAVSQYQQAFEISYEEEFQDLDDGVLQRFEEEIRNSDIAQEDTKALLWESLLFSRAAEASSYVELKEIVTENADWFGISLSKYQQLSEYQQGTLFKDLYLQGFHDFDDIGDAFDTLLDNMGSGGSGSSGGGGGNGTGGGNGGRGGASGTGSGYTPNFETTADAEKNVFNDMESHWGKEIVALLAERGIVDGMPDGGFHPDQAVTRAEYLKLLTTALGLSPVMSDSFSDVAADEWYYGIIGAAKQAGLAVGDGDSFRPR